MRRETISASASTPAPGTSSSSAQAPPGPDGRKAVSASSAENGGQRGASDAGIGVEQRLDRIPRREDDLLVRAVRAQVEGGAAPHLPPGLRELSRRIRVERGTGERRTLLVRLRQGGAQAHEG